MNWLSAYQDLAAFEAANSKLATDEGWLKYLDSLRCYAQGLEGEPDDDLLEDSVGHERRHLHRETADESSNELVGHFVEALPPASADASDPVAP